MPLKSSSKYQKHLSSQAHWTGVNSDSEAYTSSDLELEDSVEEEVMHEIQTDSDLLAFTAKLQASGST